MTRKGKMSRWMQIPYGKKQKWVVQLTILCYTDSISEFSMCMDNKVSVSEDMETFLRQKGGQMFTTT